MPLCLSTFELILHVIILSLLITYRPVCVSQTDQSVCVKQTGLFDTNRPDRSVCVKQTGLYVSNRLVCLCQTEQTSLYMSNRPVCLCQTDRIVSIKQTGLFVSNRPVCLQPVYIVIQTGLFVTSLYSNTDRCVCNNSMK